MKTKKIKKKYIKSVSRHIKCSKELKQSFLDSLSNSIDDIISENTVTTLDELKNILGKPLDVAKDFENTLEFEFLRKYKIKKVAIITAIILLIVALLICFYCYLVYYATEPIYIYEAPVKEILDN